MQSGSLKLLTLDAKRYLSLISLWHMPHFHLMLSTHSKWINLMVASSGSSTTQLSQWPTQIPDSVGIHRKWQQHQVRQKVWRLSWRSVSLISKGLRPNVPWFAPSKARSAAWHSFCHNRMISLIKNPCSRPLSKKLATSACFYQSFIVNLILLRWWVFVTYFIITSHGSHSTGVGANTDTKNTQKKTSKQQKKEQSKFWMLAWLRWSRGSSTAHGDSLLPMSKVWLVKQQHGLLSSRRPIGPHQRWWWPQSSVCWLIISYVIHHM